jgi:hypothetical protein
MNVSYHQNDWVTLLPLAEYAYNNAKHSGSKFSPFYLNYGMNPRLDWSFKAVREQQSASDEGAQQLAKNLEELHATARNNLLRAQTRMKGYYDRKRDQDPEFKPGDKVWLDASNLKTNRPSKKLDSKNLGPFEVIEKIGSRAYRLKLPATIKVHPVFHVSLLSKYRASNIPGRAQPPPPPVVVDNEEEWYVERIADIRWDPVRKQPMYLVKWEGYPLEEAQWKPYAELLDEDGDPIVPLADYLDANPDAADQAKKKWDSSKGKKRAAEGKEDGHGKRSRKD